MWMRRRRRLGRRGLEPVVRSGSVAVRWPGAPGGQVIVDVDATLVTAHSDKEGAAATFKRGYGFHPMLAFVDHGQPGTGEPLVGLLRTGSASAWAAADHLSVLEAALGQVPADERARVLVRADTGAAS